MQENIEEVEEDTLEVWQYKDVLEDNGDKDEEESSEKLLVF